MLVTRNVLSLVREPNNVVHTPVTFPLEISLHAPIYVAKNVKTAHCHRSADLNRAGACEHEFDCIPPVCYPTTADYWNFHGLENVINASERYGLNGRTRKTTPHIAQYRHLSIHINCQSLNCVNQG